MHLKSLNDATFYEPVLRMDVLVVSTPHALAQDIRLLVNRRNNGRESMPRIIEEDSGRGDAAIKWIKQ